jgi:hypothetical protein
LVPLVPELSGVAVPGAPVESGVGVVLGGDAVSDGVPVPVELSDGRDGARSGVSVAPGAPSVPLPVPAPLPLLEPEPLAPPDDEPAAPPPAACASATPDSARGAASAAIFKNREICRVTSTSCDKHASLGSGGIGQMEYRARRRSPPRRASRSANATLAGMVLRVGAATNCRSPPATDGTGSFY